MTFYIEQIKIELTEDAYGLRLTALDEALPLPGQTIAETQETYLFKMLRFIPKHVKQ